MTVHSKWTTGGLEFYNTGTTSIEFRIPAPSHSFAFGEEGVSFDVYFYGATTGSHLLWDEGGDRAILDNADFYLGDNDNISFGDSQDIVMAWTTGATQMFDVIPAAANADMNFGSSGYPLDVNHYGNVKYRRPASTTTTGVTLTLTVASNRMQTITSCTDGLWNIVLPPATTAGADGSIWYLSNACVTPSSGNFAIFDGSTAGTMLSLLELDETGIYICNGASYTALVGNPST